MTNAALIRTLARALRAAAEELERAEVEAPKAISTGLRLAEAVLSTVMQRASTA